MHTPDPTTSLGNYIALTSGFVGHPTHISANRGPRAWPQDSVSLFEQTGPDGWKELSESAPDNCFAGKAVNFTVNHTPAPYYTRIRNQCLVNDVPMGPEPDLSARFTLLSPNKRNIMHREDGVVATQRQLVANGDTWAAGYLPKVFASPEYRAGRTVVIVTWDEGSATRTDIPFLVVSPYTTPGTVVTTRMDHYSTLKGIEEMLGITTYLGHAGDLGVRSIRDFYGLS